MEQLEKKVNVFLSKDGKEFLNEIECLNHENLLDKISKFKYYLVSHGIDKTETGAYFNKTLVAIGSNDLYLDKEDILINWGIKTFGAFLECSVQGYGIQRTFIYREVKREDYEECKSYCIYSGWGSHKPKKVFISSEKIEGFPEHYDLKKEWNIK